MSIPILVLAMTAFSPFYNYALVRDLSPAFEESLKINPPPTPINLDLAKEQHVNYMNVLKGVVQDVILIDADPAHPDCNFIEDTAIVVNDIAVISRMGAPERRGEEIPIAEALKTLGERKIVKLQAPATMDGGDILYTGNHLFVGISKRTNKEALQQLEKIFAGKVSVVGIPVTEGLHLKSVISLFDAHTLVLATTPAGHVIRSSIEAATSDEYRFIEVPDAVASNVLRIGSTLIIQEGFPASEVILQEICDAQSINLVKINMSELIKADGALTCGSLLLTSCK